MPKVYLIGYTTIDRPQLHQYLEDTGNMDFLSAMYAARQEGISDGEILCSYYAKLCYAALSADKNQNITRTRSIADNIRACFDSGHGSVFEHPNVNFVVSGCSRVFTHEAVRHRAGAAFSQTSGRYVRQDELRVVPDPMLEDYGIATEEEQEMVRAGLERYMRLCNERINELGADFATRKALTSAVRRLLPNGQENELGMSLNFRALRHTVMMRTSRHAETEIRDVFGQVYMLCKERFPLLFCGAREEVVKGLLEVTGMRTQPYEYTPPAP